eukprot:535778_1
MAFSILFIMSGLLTVLSRVIHFGWMKRKNIMKQYYFTLDIDGKLIQDHHIHSHWLIQCAISKAIKADEAAIEVMIIYRTSTGVSCKAQAWISDDIMSQNYDKLFSMVPNEIKKGLKKTLKESLKVEKLKSVSAKKMKNPNDKKLVEMNTLLQTKTDSKKKKKRKKTNEKYRD